MDGGLIEKVNCGGEKLASKMQKTETVIQRNRSIYEKW
jgi:hypothetical protein